MTLCVLAGILDTYGGLRFVVTGRSDLKHHVRSDEILIVVPKLRLHEPIAWGAIPALIRRVEIEVENWLGRGPFNEPHAQEAAAMYRLRKQEHIRRTLNLELICET